MEREREKARDRRLVQLTFYSLFQLLQLYFTTHIYMMYSCFGLLTCSLIHQHYWTTPVCHSAFAVCTWAHCDYDLWGVHYVTFQWQICPFVCKACSIDGCKLKPLHKTGSSICCLCSFWLIKNMSVRQNGWGHWSTCGQTNKVYHKYCAKEYT